MPDRFSIDSHKLMYHPDRVARWLRDRGDWETAKSLYPIYVEISPIGACNHRCIFCALDFVGYQARRLDGGLLRERLAEMAGLGIKAVMFAGEGEPLLWKPLSETVEFAAEKGIDVSITSNLVPLKAAAVDPLLANSRWIKASINAGTAGTYAAVHRTDPADFDRVLANLELCVERRRKARYECTIGAQMLLIPENIDEAFLLGQALKERGIDYFVIKPYSQHPSSDTRRYANFDYRRIMKLEEQLAGLGDEGFDVVFRARAMEKTFEPSREYRACMAVPYFWAYIMSDGNVYGCSNFLLDGRFRYGNINEEPFRRIWEGPRRAGAFRLAGEGFDMSSCRLNCRMDEVNRYLWRLVHRDPHVNFI